MINKRTKQIRLVVSEEEYGWFKEIAKQNNTSISNVCRTLVQQTKNKDINDTANAIQNLEQSFEKKMIEFAKSQDIATSFLINNMGEFYETKLEKLQEKVDEMVPYYKQALQVFAAHEAVKRKRRAVTRRD